MSPTLVAYCYLAGAIICEVIGTTLLVKSEQFSRLLPSIALAIFYGVSMFFLAKAIKIIPLGIAYAIWGGVGIILTAIIGVTLFKQTIDTPAILGIALIIAGVIVINMFSQAITH